MLLVNSAGELYLYVQCMSQEPSAVNCRSATSLFDAGEPSFHGEQAGPGGEALGILRIRGDGDPSSSADPETDDSEAHSSGSVRVPPDGSSRNPDDPGPSGLSVRGA